MVTGSPPSHGVPSTTVSLPMAPASSAAQKSAAVAEHSRTADLFAQRYVEFETDPYRSAFTYSRMRLDALLAEKLPPVGSGMRLLDVGCGTGYQLRDLRKRGFDVAGIDGSEDMLRHAREINPGIDLRCGDVDSLPWEDASFELVVCVEVHRYLPDPLPCLSEIRRVLRPDGIALITAAPLFSLDGYAVINRVALHLPDALLRMLRLTRLKQFFVTSSGLRSQLFNSGFSAVELHGVHLGPLNWMQRAARSRTPALFRSWERFDAKLADQSVLRDFSSMFLACARR